MMRSRDWMRQTRLESLRTNQEFNRLVGQRYDTLFYLSYKLPKVMFVVTGGPIEMTVMDGIATDWRRP